MKPRPSKNFTHFYFTRPGDLVVCGVCVCVCVCVRVCVCVCLRVLSASVVL